MDASPRSRVARVALVAAVVVGATLVVARFLRTGPAPDADGALGVEAPPPPPGDSTLAGRRPSPLIADPPPAGPSPPARAGESSPSPRPLAEGEIRVSGHVVGADGRPARAGFVWLVDPGEERMPGRVLGEARVGPDGAYALTTERTPSSNATRLVVAIDGEETFRLAAPVVVGSESVLDVRAPDAHRVVSGRVVDPDGRPVADLPLRWTSAWTSDQYVPLARTACDADVVAGGDDVRFARTRTDADGRFTVRVRSANGLGVVSEASPWFLRVAHASPFAHGLDDAGLTESLDVRALPAVTLLASVRDAASGAPVARFEGHLHDTDGGMFVAFGGAAGALAMRFPRWWGADERRSLRLDVEEPTYAPAGVFVVYEAGAVEVTSDVRMTLATFDARADVTFDVRDAAGRPFDGDWVARIVDPRDADKTWMELSLTRIESGAYMAQVPAGRWSLLVKTGDGLGFLRSTFEADVPGGRATRLRCVMPPHGALRLVWPATASGEREGPTDGPVLVVRPANGAGGSLVRVRSGAAEYRIPALPEGDWLLEWRPKGLGRSALTRTGRVAAGAETTVDFAKP